MKKALYAIFWWEQFQDPVLDAYILTALRNNQDLKQAIARVFASALYPEITGHFVYTPTKSSIAVPIPLI